MTLIPTLTEQWKRGQFEFLDVVKRRITTFDEGQLTEMGLWVCKLKTAHFSDVQVKPALTKFAGLTDIQGDYLINTATRHMCG
jgi:hypothetical protein